MDPNSAIDQKNRGKGQIDSTHWAESKYVLVIKLRPPVQKLRLLVWKQYSFISKWAELCKNPIIKQIDSTWRKESKYVKVFEPRLLVQKIRSFIYFSLFNDHQMAELYENQWNEWKPAIKKMGVSSERLGVDQRFLHI